jgi:RNA polymerase sigma-70 factor (ECF subfamily)
MADRQDGELDEQLLEKARAGDSKSLEAIWNGWNRTMRAVARRVGVRSVTFFLNGVLADLGDALKVYTPQGKFGAWLRTLVFWKARTHVKRERQGGVPAEFDETLIADDHIGPDGAAEVRDEYAKALAGLDERSRTVLELHYKHGYSHDEIAERLGITVDNSYQICTRAKKRARKNLELQKRRDPD